MKNGKIISGILAGCLGLQAGTASLDFKSNSPVKAGDEFILKAAISPNAKKASLRFNGKTIHPATGIKVFNASGHGHSDSVIQQDAEASFGKSVSGTKKYQTIFVADFPQDGKPYAIWVRAKNGALCLRKTANDKLVEEKWNWKRSEDYSWRLFGIYSNRQIGKKFGFMIDGRKPSPALDCIVLSPSGNYTPHGKISPLTQFTWQTDTSSVGTHELPLTAEIDGQRSIYKIKVEVKPAAGADNTSFKLPANSCVDIPLGKAAQTSASYPDFNIFNRACLDFFNRPVAGLDLKLKSSFIALHCKKYPDLPKKVIIPVKGRFAALAFLHTEYWQGELGQKVACYKVKYRDGSTIEIPIREEINISGSARTAETPDALFLYDAKSPVIDFHISLFVWKNPEPDKEIASVEFSNMFSRFLKEENRTVPLNVSSISSQILLKIIGINKPSDAVKLTDLVEKNRKISLTPPCATVNYNLIAGQINPRIFSTNETGFMDSENPEFGKYLKVMDKIGCRIFRLHSGWNLAKIYPKGINGPHNYQALDAGISKLLKGHPEREIMICINKIPPYIKPEQPEDREHFAMLCADLLKHFMQQKIKVKYWEIYNEVYFRGIKADRSLWKMYNLTAAKLKKLKPNIKVGGYAPCYPTLSGITDFYKHCHQNTDFISWHKYPTGSSKTSDAYLMGKAYTFGDDVRAIRRAVHAITPGKKVELALTEYNMNYNWRPHDPRQRTWKGAIWMAAVLYNLIKADLDIAQQWHSRGGGTFGLMSKDCEEIRPTARLLYLFNKFLKSHYVYSKSSDRSIACLGFIEPEKQVGLMLINTSNKPKNIKINLLALPGLHTHPFESNATEYILGPNGFTEQSGDLASVMQVALQPLEMKLLVAPIKK